MDLNESTFDKEVINSTTPVLVDFWATWCGPCKALAPVLEEVEKTISPKAKVVKIDVDLNKNLAAKYNIRSVPTLLFFKNGAVCKNLIGTQSKEELIRSLEELI